MGEGRIVLLPGELPIRNYTLAVTATVAEKECSETATLLIAPRAAYQGADVARRLWALAVPLYGLRSARNWGNGDFTDLAAPLRLAAELGAAGIALNPLHALFDDRAEEASPYTCQHVGDRALGDCQAGQSFAQLGQTLEADQLAAVQIGDRSLYAGADNTGAADPPKTAS
jgi:hypothetical protein